MICRNDLEPLERKIKKIKTSLNQIDIKNLLQDNWSNFCNHQEYDYVYKLWLFRK